MVKNANKTRFYGVRAWERERGIDRSNRCRGAVHRPTPNRVKGASGRQHAHVVDVAAEHPFFWSRTKSVLLSLYCGINASFLPGERRKDYALIKKLSLLSLAPPSLTRRRLQLQLCAWHRALLSAWEKFSGTTLKRSQILDIYRIKVVYGKFSFLLLYLTKGAKGSIIKNKR